MADFSIPKGSRARISGGGDAPAKVGDGSGVVGNKGSDEGSGEAVAGDGATRAVKKVVGDVAPALSGRKAGARAALAGLAATQKPKRSWKTGAATAFLALTLFTSTPQLAFAGTPLDLTPHSAVIDQLPDGTGPPRSVLMTQISAKTNPATDAAARAAFDRFNAAVDHVLRRDAQGLASLQGPLDVNSPLSADEQKQLEHALRDLVRELPIASLWPELAADVTQLAADRGVVVNPATARVKDLGPIAGDVAKRFIDELRHEKPAVFWGTAGAVVVGVGAGAYLEGSHVLRAIGVKPEVKLKLLDGKLTAKIGADWDKRFTNPLVHVGLTTPVQLGGLTGEVGAQVDGKGPTLSDLQVSGFALSGSLGGVLDDGTRVSGATTLTFDAGATLDKATVDLSATNGPWSGSAGLTSWPQDGRFAASLGVGYRPSKDVDLYLQGMHDNAGTTAVGVGLRVRF